nr:MAG TPA: hypothetical protein [Caudoviricetes sp.]
MNDILQALAKMLNMTVDEVSSLLTTFKGNAPQLYEQLVRERTYYIALNAASDAMVWFSIALGAIIAFVVMQTEWIGGIKNSMGTIKKLLAGLALTSMLAFVFHIGKYFLAPNYLFILDEIVPKIINR